MARFNLNKGERFKLKKSDGLNKIKVILSWKGADLDACAFLVGKDGIIEDDADFVFYNSENRSEPYSREKFGSKSNWRSKTRPMSADGSFLGSIDDLGGNNDDDENDVSDEQMFVTLNDVNPKIQEILLCVTIYRGDELGITFGKVREPYVSIVNDENGDELCRYALNEKFANETAVVAGSLNRGVDGEWYFMAIGMGYEGGMQTLIDLYA